MIEKQKAYLEAELIHEIEKKGYPRRFGELIARNLGTKSTMTRMIRYLQSASPGSAEEIADEMMAILSDRDAWVEKKCSEYYTSKYNEYLRSRDD